MTGNIHIPSVAACSYPPRAGNAVRPLVDGVPAFRRIAEAIKTARHSVWLTVAFYTPDFQMPDGGGPLFDMLDRAVERGLDVRVIFWRPNQESVGYGGVFAGSPQDRRMLDARGSRFRIRWDRAQGAYCQHQKSWLIDAGQPSETAFVGGINLTAKAMGSPGHSSEGDRHDVYVEISGPSATDVHHNFVQRWNEASERAVDDGLWGHDADDVLGFPTGHRCRAAPASCRSSARCMPPATVRPMPVPEAILTMLLVESALFLRNTLKRSAPPAARSISRTRRFLLAEIAAALEQALARGVEVVILIPAEPEDDVRRARQDPQHKTLFDGLATLDRYENFALVGIAALDTKGRRGNIYVHSKIMLVDDAWATIGSCNLHSFSLSGNSEMNASIWDPQVVRALRCELLAEHLDRDTTGIDVARRLASTGRSRGRIARRREANDREWQGLAFSLDPAAYGREARGTCPSSRPHDRHHSAARCPRT